MESEKKIVIKKLKTKFNKIKNKIKIKWKQKYNHTSNHYLNKFTHENPNDINHS